MEFETAYTFGELYNYFQIPHLSHVLGKGQSVVILTKREGTECSVSDQEATVTSSSWWFTQQVTQMGAYTS